MNNSFNVIIDLFVNEINYDFKIRKTLFNMTKRQITNLLTQRIEYKQKTTNVFVFVNAKTKIYYDFKHMFFIFKIDDQIYLRLHHDYQLFDKFNKKIFQQRCDSFSIKRRIDWLTYEWKLSFIWRVHFVVFVVQFEFVSKNENFCHRFRHIYSKTMKMNDDTFQFRFYEIKKLIKKRVRKYNIIEITQYLIRWFDYDFEYDEWRNLFVLHNCMNLMKKFETNHSKKNIICRVREISFRTFEMKKQKSKQIFFIRRDRNKFKKKTICCWYEINDTK